MNVDEAPWARACGTSKLAQSRPQLHENGALVPFASYVRSSSSANAEGYFATVFTR